jgi:ribosomal protein L24E
MVSLSSLLGACPNGAWVTEDVAMEVLGVASKDVLQKKFSEGLLPHVHVEHGNRVKASPPYDKHRFFYIQKAGSNASPAVGLGDWLDVMAKVDTAGTDLIDSEAADVIKKVTNGTDAQNAFKEMQKVNAVVSSSSLSIQGSVGTSSDGYNYGTSGGSARVPSKSSAKDGEIYVRADGKKVRRVKKSKSSGGKSSNLSNFLDGADRPKKKFGSKSVVGDGEIYVRADGKKVRRVRKSSQSVGGSGASVGDINATPKKKSLGGFLDKDGPSITKIGESNSVAGDMIATRDLTGEIYVRADGKKVRRVKKIASTDGSNVEIITRPDGTKVKRIRKVKTVADSSDAASTEGRFNGLSGFLEKGTGGVLKKKFSGSHSVAGDQNIQGEIYVRSDGKKVRRVKKAKPLSSAAGATVAADTNPEKTEEKPETEIYTRPDGTKVRRIRRTAKKKVANTENSSSGDSDRKKSLAGFLSKAEPTKPKIGGSASVAGDMIATRGLTGEVYVRADGKKVRRVKKIAPKEGKADESSNVEIITRPDGKKVRRIRKTKVKPKGLSGFLDSQPKSKQIGGAATVGGDIVSKKEVAPLKPLTGELRKKQEPEEKDKPKETQAKKTLEGFLSRMDSKPKLMGQSASVAGDQIAVAKGESLTGEVYVRSDGKKVRRVKKSSAVQPGDQVEIITRPDGTKVRRIKRAKKPTGDAASVSSTPGGTGSGFKKSLAGFLSKSPALKKAGSGSASVSGDMLHRNVGLGEIYVRADGKKVRRVRKSVSGASVASGGAGVKGGEEYEIYTRADGKKVRRIRRKKEPAKNEQSLSSMLQKDKNIARPGGGAATVGDIGVKSTLKATPAATVAGDLIMNKDAVKSETATTRPTSAAPPIAAAEPAVKYSKLSSGDETTASQYRLMLKRGLPEGAVHHKMLSDGVAQNIIDSVLAREAPAGATPQQFPADANVQVVPNGMVLVPKDQAAVPDGMVLVPKEQAQRTIPEGMIVVDKGKETVPDGFVLVPKDKVKGDIGDDLILVNKSQVRDSTFVLGAKDDKDLKEDVKEDDEIKAAKNSNVITIDDLPGRVEMLKAEGKTFLLQALPNDSNLQNDFIKKNLLPKDIKAARTAPTKKAPAPATSGSIAEILAKMSTMGGDFDAEKMGELLSKSSRSSLLPLVLRSLKILITTFVSRRLVKSEREWVRLVALT